MIHFSLFFLTLPQGPNHTTLATHTQPPQTHVSDPQTTTNSQQPSVHHTNPQSLAPSTTHTERPCTPTTHTHNHRVRERREFWGRESEGGERRFLREGAIKKEEWIEIMNNRAPNGSKFYMIFSYSSNH